MKGIRLILCITALLLFSKSYGQNEKFKALFISNMTNYIDWPGGTGSVFVIAVLGNSPIVSELEAISKTKRIGNTPIEIVNVGSAAEIGKANIVFVCASKKKTLPEVNMALSGKPVLIVSDGATSGFGVNFVEINKKQSCQISKKNMESHKLKVNAALMSLGVAVN